MSSGSQVAIVTSVSADAERQRVAPLGVVDRHHLGDAADVDLQRVDAQVGQVAALRQPFGQRLDVERLAARRVRQPGAAEAHAADAARCCAPAKRRLVRSASSALMTPSSRNQSISSRQSSLPARCAPVCARLAGRVGAPLGSRVERLRRIVDRLARRGRGADSTGSASGRRGRAGLGFMRRALAARVGTGAARQRAQHAQPLRAPAGRSEFRCFPHAAASVARSGRSCRLSAPARRCCPLASAAGCARASAPNAAAMRRGAGREARVAAEQVDRHHAAVGAARARSRGRTRRCRAPGRRLVVVQVDAEHVGACRLRRRRRPRRAASISSTVSRASSPAGETRARHAPMTAGFSSTAVVRIRSTPAREARDRGGAEAELHRMPRGERLGGRSSIQTIMRCTYSSSMARGLPMRIAPCTQGVPRCR